MGEVGMMSTQGLNRCLVIKKVLVIIHQTYALLNWQLDYQDWWSQNPPVHGLTYSTELSFRSLYPYLQFLPLGSHQNTLSLLVRKCQEGGTCKSWKTKQLIGAGDITKSCSTVFTACTTEVHTYCSERPENKGRACNPTLYTNCTRSLACDLGTIACPMARKPYRPSEK